MDESLYVPTVATRRLKLEFRLNDASTWVGYLRIDVVAKIRNLLRRVSDPLFACLDGLGVLCPNKSLIPLTVPTAGLKSSNIFLEYKGEPVEFRTGRFNPCTWAFAIVVSLTILRSAVPRTEVKCSQVGSQ